MTFGSTPVTNSQSSPGNPDYAAAIDLIANVIFARLKLVDPTENSTAPFGVQSNPIRTDPTGTTMQPVNGTVTANLGTLNGAATAGNQTTQSNLLSQISAFVELLSQIIATSDDAFGGKLGVIGGRREDSKTTIDDGHVGELCITPYKALKVCLFDAAGNVISTMPVSLDISSLANQATQALIKAKTDNLDVALSTRTKPSDQQHAIIDSGTVTANLGTIAGVSTEATLAAIKAKTDNLDVALSTRTKPADAQHAIIDSGKVGHDIGAPTSFSGTVTTAGTAVRYSSSSIPCKRVSIMNPADSNAILAVGDSSVVCTAGSQVGWQLNPGDGRSFDCSDVNQIYINSDTNGGRYIGDYS